MLREEVFARQKWTKRVASHWGGTRNGLVVHWPRGIKARGELRHQFHHVIDVAPTLLEAAQLPEPLVVNGVGQQPIEGVGMACSFDDADAAERHETQYFEILGNRGIYHKGWTAVTAHGPPVSDWPTQPLPFASDEPLEIGSDCGSPVTPDYRWVVFTGEVSRVDDLHTPFF